MYWIDPNGGTIKDAIWVYCDKSKNSSCVYPKHPQVMQTLLLAQCGGACVSRIQALFTRREEGYPSTRTFLLFVHDVFTRQVGLP